MERSMMERVLNPHPMDVWHKTKTIYGVHQCHKTRYVLQKVKGGFKDRNSEVSVIENLTGSTLNKPLKMFINTASPFPPLNYCKVERAGKLALLLINAGFKENVLDLIVKSGI